jgi:hypothetical protein
VHGDTIPATFAGRTLLVLGGKPIGSCDIVRHAREHGARVIVADYLPPAQSPAKQLADDHWEISTADLDALASRAIQEGVDAVFTGAHEFNIRQCQRLARRLGLPFYASEAQLRLTSNKPAYKALFAAYGLDSIPRLQIGAVDTFPVLIKPVEGSGAYGIRLCTSRAQFQQQWEQALAEAGDAQDLLIEPFLAGQELTAFYLVRDGRFQLTGVADRLTTPVGDGLIRLPYLYHWPSRHLPAYLQSVDAKVVRALEAMQLCDGMVFIQFIACDGRIMPYDMGYRITGTQEYHLLERACRFNPLKLLVHHAFTGQLAPDTAVIDADPWLGGQHAASLTFLARPGRIARFVGLEQVAALVQTVAVIRNHEEGSEIPATAAGTLNQVALRVLLLAGDRTELLQAQGQVARMVRVLDPDGADLLIPSPYGNLAA